MNIQARPSLLPQMARLFAAQAKTYCLSALVPGILGIASLTLVSILMVRGAGEGQLDSRVIWDSMSAGRRFMAIFGLLLALWTPILLAARGACRIATEQLSGRPVSLPRIWIDMAKFIPAALVYAVAMGLPIMIGFGIYFVPGMVIASFFVLVIPAAIHEPLSIFAALHRGFSLAGLVFVKNLLITLVCGVLLGLLLFLRITFIDRYLPDSFKAMFAIKFAILYLPALLLLLLANIGFTLLYEEARAREATTAPDAPRL
jgi:hypothetical protein